MKTILRYICTLLFVFTLFHPVTAQVKLKVEGPVFDLAEAAAIIVEQEGKITVIFTHEDMRAEAYKNLDLKIQDEVFMANGQKIKSIDQLQKIYDALKVGEVLKLAVKREGKALMVSIEKADPDSLPKRKIIKKEMTPEEAKEMEDGGQKIIMKKESAKDE